MAETVDPDRPTDAQWARLAVLMPGGCKGKRGPRTNNRLFLDAPLWMARSGSRWRDLPERFGDYRTVKRRYFARLRRMVQGQHHGVSPRYLCQYAEHAAWCEDHRRRSNGANAGSLLGLALHHPVSRNWAEYWQRGA